MNQLSSMKCEACSVNAHRLSSDEAESLMSDIAGWSLLDDSGIQKLKRIFSTENFRQSISFTNAIAELAETEQHHPQIVVEYSSVTVFWWTHKINGLHKNDFIMAAKTSNLYNDIQALDE
ncbi:MULTISPECIES: 4a-hydroxytetrahydrobiopterin dehydratase [unclassified Carboxylicivirga]|uniref:4a-hydroxytetrahydrobiopterin dehydratase n=1 Tax=Carboxylicivirga TaxID=1628153 RepID=UPI003D33EA14